MTRPTSPLPAVQAYADMVGTQLDEYLTRHEMDPEALATREYRSMMDTLDDLESSFARILTQDQAQFDEFWGTLRTLIGAGGPLPGHDSFAAAGEALAVRGKTALAQLRRRITDEVVIHLDVPEDLAKTAEDWEQAGQQTRQAAAVLPRLQHVASWQGGASGHYRQMVSVQANAQEEHAQLAGVMAQAYAVIGSLNRAVLIAVHAVVRSTLLDACGAPERGPGMFFGGLERFVCAVERCASELLPAALDIADEAANEVATAVGQAHASTHVIDETWPSGTARADRLAAQIRVPRLARHC